MQKQEQEDEKQLIVQTQTRRLQHPLSQSNQYLPREQLRVQHQYSRLKLQVIKSRFHMSILSVAFCIVAYLGVIYWISVAIPVGPMSSYASVIAGGFPPNVFAIVAAAIIFAVICLELLERINPEIARQMREEYQRERQSI